MSHDISLERSTEVLSAEQTTAPSSNPSPLSAVAVPPSTDALPPEILSGPALREWWRALSAAFTLRAADEHTHRELTSRIAGAEQAANAALARLQMQLEEQHQNGKRQQLTLLTQADQDHRRKFDRQEEELRLAAEEMSADQSAALNQAQRKLRHDQWEIRSIYEGTAPGPKIRYHQVLQHLETQFAQQSNATQRAIEVLRSARLHSAAAELEHSRLELPHYDAAESVEEVLQTRDERDPLAELDSDAADQNSAITELHHVNAGGDTAAAANVPLPAQSLSECQQRLREAFSRTAAVWNRLDSSWRLTLLRDNWPWVLMAGPAIVIAVVVLFTSGKIPAAITFGALLWAGFFGVSGLRRTTSHALLPIVAEWRSARSAAVAATQDLAAHAVTQMRREQRDLREKLRRDLLQSEEQFKRQHAQLLARHRQQTQEHQQRREAALAELTAEQSAARTAAERKFQPILTALQRNNEREQAAIRASCALDLESLRQQQAAVWDRLLARWQGEHRELLAGFERWRAENHERFPAWDRPEWADWQPPTIAPRGILFGELAIEMAALAAGCQPHPDLPISLPERWTLPAVLDFPRRSSFIIQATGAGREFGLQLLQAVLLRLLLSLPPAKVRFTIIDPVGLGKNFAGMMHLADYDEALVTSRIWTEPLHIEQRLTDLSEQIEVIIQKYLRNEFPSIDAYNVAAGEVAEPFRFLVVANFPRNFTESAARRLLSIAHSGPRCGVFVLLLADMQLNLPSSFSMEDLTAAAETLVWDEDHFRYDDPDFGSYKFAPLTLPDEETITRLVHAAGHAARDGRRVEVPFRVIAPAPDTYWKADTSVGLDVPLGRAGARKKQSLRLGSGTSQHVLMAGKTGSGKSTLLHTIIINACLAYSPAELELYLIDFKKGVEFKDYALFRLPHARVIAIESEREFGLSALARLDAEMQARGELFRLHGKQDLAGYRAIPGMPPLPRIMLLIDEFQEFFTEDDRVSQQATLLLDRLVRQGRAFGIHLLLGSQTLGGAFTLARSTISQMAVRIALQCSESDADLILADDNSAARLLNRPGEAIYNDANGRLEGNSPFQVAWLGEAEREEYLRLLRAMADDWLRQKEVLQVHDGSAAPTATGRELLAVADWQTRRQVVFEGSAAADLRENRILNARLAEAAASARGLQDTNNTSSSQKPPESVTFYLGDPVSIKDPTAAVIRRQAGANLLVLGQAAEQSQHLFAALLVNLAAAGLTVDKSHQLNVDDRASLQKSDGTEPNSPPFGREVWLLEAAAHDGLSSDHISRSLGALAQQLKLPHHSVARRDIPSRFGELAAEIDRRHTAGDEHAPPIYLIIHNLSRFRDLRRDENDLGYSFGSEPAAVSADKHWQSILREGPAVGVHTIVWCDTLANLMRCVDRATLREFDLRVLFQMNPSDSSQLVDSPAASKLGRHFALFSHEETGQLDKFRPYAWPDEAWLRERFGGG